jgi:hypothetical protein
MNLVLGLILTSFGQNLDLKCTVGHSDQIYLRDSRNLEKTVTYMNKGAKIDESLSMSNLGFVSVEKYGRTITMVMECKKIQ